MPGVYAAQRAAPPGKAGLRLPFTPTTGPIELGVDTGNLKLVGQDQPVTFTAGELAGVYTKSVGECSVFIVAEWSGSKWGTVYFNHLGGSYWGAPPNPNRFAEFAKRVDKNVCYAAVLGTSRYNAVSVAEALLDNKIPAQNISVYIACINTIDVGFVVENGFFGEIPPSRGGISSSEIYGDLGPFSSNFSKY